MSIRLRLALWYGGAMALTVIVAAAIVWFRFSGDLRATLEEALAVQVADTTAAIKADHGALILREDPARPGIFTVVVARDGTILARSRNAPAHALPVTPGASTWQSSDAPELALFAAPALGGRTVIAGASLDRTQAEVERLAILLAVVAGLASVVSVAGGWLLAGRAMRPVRLLTDEADRIHTDVTTRSRRLVVANPGDELGRLASTMNRMLDRVESGMEQQQRFVASASHDLRTPIAALRTELDLALRSDADEPMLREAVQDALGDAVRLGRLADGLLALAAAQHEDPSATIEPVPLAELAKAVAKRATAAAGADATTVELEIDEITVVAAGMRLEQVLGNLVGNAVRHSPRGGVVVVRAHLTGLGLAAQLEVDVLDRGPGVDASRLPGLFSAFSHPPSEDGGVGLGLAVAAAAARAAGGSIGYRDRPGGGAWFWFRMPAHAITRGVPSRRSMAAAVPSR